MTREPQKTVTFVPARVHGGGTFPAMGLLVVYKHVLKHASGRCSYRRTFPPEVRSLIPGATAKGRQEHKVSLGRQDAPDFDARYRAADAAFQAIVRRARRELIGDFDRLDAPTIAFLVETYRVAELEADTLRRWDADAKGRAAMLGDAMADSGIVLPPATGGAAGRWTRSVRFAATALVEAGKELRSHGDLEGIVEAWQSTALMVAEQAGYLIHPGSPNFADLCIALNDAAISAHEAMLERLDGANVPTPAKPVRRRSADPVSSAVLVPELPLLATYDAYAKTQGMTVGVREEWRRVIVRLIDFLGHDDAARITPDDVLRWRDHLQAELTPKGTPRDPRTIRGKYISALKATLNWAVQERKLPSNAAAAVVVRVPKKAKLRERDFTAEEARAILTATLVPPTRRQSPEFLLARRWIPWLCAYTGARVNEFSQLRGKDVRQVDGIWTVRITPEAGSVKNNEARVVPLHSHLIEQGFVDVVAGLGDGPLFYDPKRQRVAGEGSRHFKKVGERLAQWVRKDVGIIDPSLQPNHAWRHTFKTRAFAAGVQERIVDAIQGHAPSSVSQSYGSTSVATMLAAIEQMPRFQVG